MVDISKELLMAYVQGELPQDATSEIVLALARDETLRQTVESLRVAATKNEALGDDDEDEEAGREADLRARVLEAAAAAPADKDYSLVIESTKERTDDISGLIDLRSMTQTGITTESDGTTEDDLASVRPSVPPLMNPQPPKRGPWLVITVATSVTVLIILGALLINWLHVPGEAEIATLEAKIETLGARLADREAEEGTQKSMETALILQELENLRAERAKRHVTHVEEEQPATVPVDDVLPAPEKSRTVALKKDKQSSDNDDDSKPKSDTEKQAVQTPPSNDPNDLLGPETPAVQSAPQESSKPSSDVDEMPETLTKSQVRSGLEKVAGAVEKCIEGQSGVMEVQFVIMGASGAVESAEATGEFHGTPYGACAARAVKMARFRSFKKPSLKVTYPFNFSGLSNNPYEEQEMKPLAYKQTP